MMKPAERKGLVVTLCIALLTAFSTAVAAQVAVPARLPIQGYLSDDTGMPYGVGTPVNVTMTFTLHPLEASAGKLHEEVQTVLVSDGRFSAYIGDAAPLDLTLFRDHQELWVGIEVDAGAGTEALPRFQLGMVPYAASAQFAGQADSAFDAEQLGGVLAADYALASELTAAVSPTLVQTRVASSCAAGSSISAIAEDGTVSCEADDDTDTTYAAGTGLTLTGTTFAVSPTYVQRRVSGTCGAGSSINAIAEDGTVSCEADDDTDTTYAAGTGLTLTGTTFAVSPTYVQRRVSGTCGAGSSINAIAEDGTVSCEADDDTDTTYAAGAALSLSADTFAVKYGTGLTLVADLGTGVLQADLGNTVQRQLDSTSTGTCGAGTFVASIDADGLVYCDLERGLGYAATTSASVGTLGPNDTNWAFIGLTDNRTVVTTDTILVQGQAALGATAAADGLDVAPCYKAGGPSGAAPTSIGGGLTGLTVAASERHLFSVSGVVTNLDGNHTFGICARATTAATWDSNANADATVIVLD